MMTGKQEVRYDFVYGVFFAFCYICLDRTIQIPYINGTSLFAWISRVVTAFVFIIFILKFCERHTFKAEHSSLGITALYAVYTVVTTVMNDNSVYHAFASAYPVLGMSMFLMLMFMSSRNCTVFINAIANLYVILTSINLICIVLLPGLFGDVYFLGLENQIGYTLVIGELFVYVDSKLSRTHVKKNCYNLICVITLFLIFSGSNIIGLLVMIAYHLILPFQKFVKKHNIGWFAIGYCVLWILLMSVNSSSFLNSEPIKFLIEDVLKKNTTLTSRTYIWMVAFTLFLQKKWLGHGIGTTTNLFYVHKDFINRVSIDASYSAHNQVLQSLYEIGLLGIGIVVALLLVSDRRLRKCKDDNIIGIFRVAVITTLIMMLAEAPGLYSLIFILNFAVVIPRLFNEN